MGTCDRMSTKSELQLSRSQFKHGSKLFDMKNKQEIKLDLGKFASHCKKSSVVPPGKQKLPFE